MQRKSFVLLILLACSCRTVQREQDQQYWEVCVWPKLYPGFDVSNDWVAYEQRTVLMEMRITKLEIAVDRLDKENKLLTAQLEQQIGWSDFWKGLTTILVKERGR